MSVFTRKLLTGNPYWLPLLVLIVCVWRLFVRQLPANDGLGWDGYRYYLLTVDGLNSSVLDSYLVLRVFPSLLIHVLFKVLSISFNAANVILAFKVLNTLLLTCSAWMVKRIFDNYELKDWAQLTGFAIIFLNYGVLNFTFYYPVMTDTPAFFLSVALFYFYVQGQLTNIFLTGLIGAFTWPVLLPMALALLLFPKTETGYQPLNKWVRYSLGALCFIYAFVISWYLIFSRNEKTDMAYTLPLSYGMLPVTFIFIVLLYFFMSYVLNNRSFFQLEYYRTCLNGNRFFAAVSMIVLFLILHSAITIGTSSEYLSLYHQVKIHLMYAFQRPLITVVSHFNYFGCIMLLMILFWKRFTAFISTFGVGVAASILFCLLAFFMKPESRALIFFFPWLMILMALFLGKYNFSKAFYFLIVFINFITAKLWLFFEYKDGPLLPDGTIDFPNQWFMMHLGIWMTEQVWLLLCIALTVSLLMFSFSLYKIKLGKKAILFYQKFEPVCHD